ALDLPKLASLVDELSQTGKGLVMTMGKGGVGKTTVAASVAVSLAKRGHKVHLTTSDPAAHLSYTLDGSLPNLQVSRIDPKVETERYGVRLENGKYPTLRLFAVQIDVDSA